MLNLLNVEKFIKNLTPVTSTEITTRDGGFHVSGLFSESIFGTIGSVERRKTYSYIDLGIEVIHPTILRFLYRLDARVKFFLSTEISYAIEDGNLIEDPEGKSGIKDFIDFFDTIKFKLGTPAREEIYKVIQKCYKDKTMFIRYLPVIPPDYRDAYKDEDGNWIVDKLNTDYYITIMKRSSSAKSSKGSGVLFDLMCYGLQQSIVDHNEYIHTRVAKKSGIIRGQLLGKTVDFSGRSVITPGPDLKVTEVGMPLRMAVSLFEPFIIHYLLYSKKVDQKMLSNEIEKHLGIPASVDSVRKLIKSIRIGDKLPTALYDIFSQAAESVMTNRAVIVKRDPVLQPESVRAFNPKLTHGNSLQISPLVTTGYNADFDGDTVAVFHPLSDESQAEIQEKMMRARTSTSSSSISFAFNKEMYAGLYLITKDIKRKDPAISVNNEDLEKAIDPYIPVVYKKQHTTMGKAIFNSCFPEDFPFIDKLINKKELNKIIDSLFKKYDDEIVKDSATKLSKIGFKFATIMAPTISIDNFELPDEIYKIKEKLGKVSIEEADKLLNDAQKILINHLKDTGFYDLVESGAGKGWTQPMQIMVAKGIIADTEGNILPPIKGSFTEGLTNEEFYNAAPGAMKGIIDRVHNTADTGYLSRRLAFVLNTVEADPYLYDCKTKMTLNIKLDSGLIKRLTGRFVVKNDKVVKFDPNDYNPGDLIHLRTPIYCKSPKICLTCYGELIKRGKTPYIGITASQVIGERGTQLIMKTFHTGGGVKLAVKDMISEIVDSDPYVEK